MKSIAVVVKNTYFNDARVVRLVEEISLYWKIHIICKQDISKKLNYGLPDNTEIRFAQRYSSISKSSNSLESEKNASFTLRAFRKLFLLRAIRGLRRGFMHEYNWYCAIVDTNADIIYCNDYNTLLVSFMASRKKHAKLIYDSHELWFDQFPDPDNLIMRFKFKLNKMIEHYILHHSDLNITVSRGIAHILSERHSIDAPLIVRNLDPVKPPMHSTHELRKQWHIPESSIILAYSGGMIDERGIPELISLMEHLDDRYHLVLLGSGHMYKYIDKINSNNRIHYIGFIPQQLLNKYLSACDIGMHLLRPSNINNINAFPNKLSQYMNAGLALCVFSNENTEEIISVCKCGITVNSNTVSNLVDTVHSITDNLMDYKHNSRECIIKHYNYSIDSKKLIKAIKSL